MEWAMWVVVIAALAGHLRVFADLRYWLGGALLGLGAWGAFQVLSGGEWLLPLAQLVMGIILVKNWNPWYVKN
mgnify:FL=1